MLKFAAVFVGRFNPPTIGHYFVLDRLKDYIVSHPELNVSPEVFVIIVDGEKTGQDKTRNPLSKDERVDLMSKSKSGQGCKFITAGTSVEGFNQVREQGYEPVLIAGGPERVSNYVHMLQDYDPSYDRIAFTVKRNKINPDDASSLFQHLSSDDINVMSGTLARKAALAGDKKAFSTITGLSGEDADKLFNLIKSRIEEFKSAEQEENEIYSVPDSESKEDTNTSQESVENEKPE